MSGPWLDFYLEGLAFRLFLAENLIVFFESTTIAVPHYGCVVNVGFNVGTHEKFESISVSNVQKENRLRECFTQCVGMCIPPKFVVYNYS